MWIYTHLKRQQKLEKDEIFNRLKLLCSFINPKAARELFTEGEVSENVGFIEDIKSMDPNFNPKEYEDVLED